MELSEEDRAILSHVVVDPDAWVAHALATVGESSITAKIERWKSEYLAQKDLPGYKTRAEREAEVKPTK
jgi:hypothetical protein